MAWQGRTYKDCTPYKESWQNILPPHERGFVSFLHLKERQLYFLQTFQVHIAQREKAGRIFFSGHEVGRAFFYLFGREGCEAVAVF